MRARWCPLKEKSAQVEMSLSLPCALKWAVRAARPLLDFTLQISGFPVVAVWRKVLHSPTSSAIVTVLVPYLWLDVSLWSHIFNKWRPTLPAKKCVPRHTPTLAHARSMRACTLDNYAFRLVPISTFSSPVCTWSCEICTCKYKLISGKWKWASTF